MCALSLPLRKVYCAGPLFNAAERREMEEIAQTLQRGGFETFVPHADGMEFAKVFPYLVAKGYEPLAIGQLLHTAVFALDTYQVVEGCGSLVCNLNGRVPDEGAVAELTMAWMLGKPVVLFKEDARSKIEGRDNPLVIGQTGFEKVRELTQLPAALAEQIALVNPDFPQPTRLPPRVADAVYQGKQLWAGLQALGSARPDDEVAELILALFALPQPRPSTSASRTGGPTQSLTATLIH